jgi:predicted transcriptional regulator of viral defense system
MATLLGALEAQFLAYSQARRRESVRTGELVGALGWSAEQERKVLSRLARKGLIARVRRGLYLVPPQLPQGGRWSPSEFLALSTLIGDQEGRYQISGPNAFYRYGWTDQVPNRIYAYNNRISGDRQVGAVSLTLIKVADQRLGETEEVSVPEGIKVVYATKARALVDAVYDWSRFDSLPQGFNWISQEVMEDNGFAAKLIQATIQFGNQGTIRRIGAALQRIKTREPLLRWLEGAWLEEASRPPSRFIPMIPNRAKRGTKDTRWKVVLNDG